MNIRFTGQRRCTGCAVACVAMLAGVSYERAARAIHGRRVPPDHSATVDQCIRALRKLGFKCKRTETFDRKRPMMLLFGWGRSFDDPGCCHCVVWDPSFGGRLVDPGGCHYGKRFYFSRWQRTGREALVITGRR